MAAVTALIVLKTRLVPAVTDAMVSAPSVKGNLMAPSTKPTNAYKTNCPSQNYIKIQIG